MTCVISLYLCGYRLHCLQGNDLRLVVFVPTHLNEAHITISKISEKPKPSNLIAAALSKRVAPSNLHCLKLPTQPLDQSRVLSADDHIIMQTIRPLRRAEAFKFQGRDLIGRS